MLEQRLLIPATAVSDVMDPIVDPLAIATVRGDLDTLKRLCVGPRSDAVSAEDSFENTLLHYAAWHNRLSIVRWLLDEKHVPIAARNKFGSTPLHSASWRGAEAPAQLLLRRGAPVNVQNESGATPLHEAAESGSVGVARLLLVSYGADYTITNKKSLTPLQLAPARVKLQIALVIEEIERNRESKNRHLLGQLLLAGDNSAVQKLLASDSGAAARVDGNGATALHFAAQHGLTSALSMLINAKVPVDAIDSNGNTALMLAVAWGQFDAAAALIDLYRAEYDPVALMCVYARSGELEQLQWLLSRSSKRVNEHAVGGRTPLHFAAAASRQGSRQHVVSLLIEHGADVSAKDHENKTAAQVATDISLSHLIGDIEPAQRRRSSSSSSSLTSARSRRRSSASGRSSVSRSSKADR